MKEKRKIPITFSNEKLHSIIKEIIEFNSELGKFEFQITNKKDLEQNNKRILITDDKFFINNQHIVLKFPISDPLSLFSLFPLFTSGSLSYDACSVSLAKRQQG